MILKNRVKNLHDIKAIYQKYIDGTLTHDEQKALLDFLNLASNEEISEVITPFLEAKEEPVNLSEFDEVVSETFSKIKSRTKAVRKRTYWIGYAAAAVLIAVFSLTLFNHDSPAVQENQMNDVTPGSYGATLTLADGHRISLNEAQKGQIAKQGSVLISKNKNGELVYSGKGLAAMQNALSTSRGQTYSLVLPDGTKVWLNAASSISYPTSFAQLIERRVQISGEAYFEVSKDKAHPFIVITNNQQVRVLGTHFNINSYADEDNITTTLLEGSVQVSGPNPTVRTILTPNQQSLYDGQHIQVKEVNAANVISWKNGQFSFKSEELKSIMRNVGRWYNVEVNFQNELLSSRTFSGKVSRFDNVSKVLRVLERTGEVKFKIEGRKITVY